MMCSASLQVKKMMKYYYPFLVLHISFSLFSSLVFSKYSVTYLSLCRFPSSQACNPFLSWTRKWLSCVCVWKNIKSGKKGKLKTIKRRKEIREIENEGVMIGRWIVWDKDRKEGWKNGRKEERGRTKKKKEVGRIEWRNKELRKWDKVKSILQIRGKWVN